MQVVALAVRNLMPPKQAPASTSLPRRQRELRVGAWLPLLLSTALLTAPLATAAATVWTGPKMVFTKADNTDAGLAANQDRLTPKVWLTRGGTQGLYNIASEAFFSHSLSPVDTEWASGTSANYRSLNYSDWETWARSVGKPPATPGVSAVLHLKTDDIYLDIKFLSWSENNGGGFSYERSTGAIAAPSSYLLATTTVGSGSVTSSPAGIACGSTCSARFNSGTSVTLTATPAAGSVFSRWSGGCSGLGSCVVSMKAAKSVTAIFSPAPFVANTFSTITQTSATITNTINFNAADLGKTGSIFITAWLPVSSATGFAQNVPLAAVDPNAFVLIQQTASGWQVVQNGQLLPYAIGTLGTALASQSIVNNVNPLNLTGAQFCVGYGTSPADMIVSGRMVSVATIPGSSSSASSNVSCNVAASPYMGLWWNANESGWGMSITQHGSINFVAVYTYDQAGSPVWYVMSGCQVSGNRCTDTLYKVTGGTPPAVPWNGSALAVTPAGTATLSFADANNGTFDFTLNGLAGTKSITRQVFATGTAVPAIDYTDLWWNANESGWGIAITQQNTMIFATWYSYDSGGNAIWNVASSCPVSGNGCTGDLYQVSGGSPITAPWKGNIVAPKVGSVTFAFDDANNGTMSYTINGVAGSRTITRQPF